METPIKKKWYQSQTKVGAALLSASAVLGTIAGWYLGSIDPVNAIAALIAEVGALKLAFGIID